jgi:hypothetical protein
VTLTLDPSPVRVSFDKAVARLRQDRFTDALWNRRLDVWTPDSRLQEQIGRRLGWLDFARIMEPQQHRLRTLAGWMKTAGFSDVVLLGMGGSSLAPEVIRSVIGEASGHPRFHVLDSVDPDAVRAAMARPATTLFVLASKSGSTIEVSSLAAEALRLVENAGSAQPGSHFIAITDEGTKLHQQAVAGKYRDLFLNPADIGGRYSALSFFGMVPAALMGANVDALLTSARAMADACRSADPITNPGLMLGAAMAAAALDGRDKLLIRLPDHLAAFGLWIEQLIAESTGKQGIGIVPVPAGLDEREGDDCFPVSIDIPAGTDLGGEFFRWEVATATAGYLLDINPFDEPNVQQAKDATRTLLATYVAERRLPAPEAHASIDGAHFTLSEAARDAMSGTGLAEFVGLLRLHDYFAVLAYISPGDEPFAAVLDGLRTRVAAQRRCVSTFGFGPRYLHSTGQLHKGGPNTGVFLFVSAPADADRPVPGEAYSFGVLERAQAIGDFQSLDRAGRRAAHLQLPKRDPALLSRLFRQF